MLVIVGSKRTDALGRVEEVVTVCDVFEVLGGEKAVLKVLTGTMR